MLCPDLIFKVKLTLKALTGGQDWGDRLVLKPQLARLGPTLLGSVAGGQRGVLGMVN